MYIEHLRGIYETTLPTGIILSVSGVGYGVEMPLSALCELPSKGAEVSLYTYTYVKEDQLKLFGFLKHEDRMAFEILIGINGVGPKVALAILSTMSVSHLAKAIGLSDVSLLESVPGIGKRLAERLLVELKPKLERLTVSGLLVSSEPRSEYVQDPIFENQQDADHDSVLLDLRSALENLGFKVKTVDPILKKVREENPNGNLQDLMKLALLELRSGAEKGNVSNKKRSVTKKPANDILF